LLDNIAADVVEEIDVRRELRNGALVVVVEVDARLPLIGLLGPSIMQVSGHALAERA
jgi:hypothetical protein